MSQVVILTFLTDSSRLVRYPGPYQVAWYIRQHGYASQVLDFLYFMTKEQRLNLYNKFITTETKIVGWAPFLMGTIQTLDYGLDLCLEIIQEVKENFPWVKIVIGGPVVHWFLSEGYKLTSCKIDAIFEGEAEYSFLDYCDYVFKKTPHPYFQIKQGFKIIKTNKTYDISSCRMRYENNDFILPGESLGLELSRGCIFKCKFCQYPNIGKDKNDFNRSIDIIKETLIYHYENFGTTIYHIADDTLNSHRERTQRLYEMIKNLPFKIQFIGYIRIDLLDIWPEQLHILPEMGLTSCHFGIESLDPESCKLIGKGWGAKNYKTWIPKVKSYWKDDVIINCSLIAGLGKETEKDWNYTHDWFLDSEIDDFWYQALNLDYNTMSSEFEKNAAKYGYRWPDPVNKPKRWISDYTDSYSARKWCESKRTENINQKKIPSAWNYVSYLNYGFTREQILKTNYVDIENIRKQNKMSENFVTDYYNKAINY